MNKYETNTLWIQDPPSKNFSLHHRTCKNYIKMKTSLDFEQSIVNEPVTELSYQVCLGRTKFISVCGEYENWLLIAMGYDEKQSAVCGPFKAAQQLTSSGPRLYVWNNFPYEILIKNFHLGYRGRYTFPMHPLADKSVELVTNFQGVSNHYLTNFEFFSRSLMCHK